MSYDKFHNVNTKKPTAGGKRVVRTLEAHGSRVYFYLGSFKYIISVVCSSSGKARVKKL